jgi:hypothetical protein
MALNPAVIFVGLTACVVGWNFFTYKVSGRPWRNPLWMAFSLTAVALLYGIAGFIGYAVPLDNPFISQPAAWVGHIVWAQVAMASVMGLISVLPWRQGLKGL